MNKREWLDTNLDYTRAVIAERDALRKAAQMALEALEWMDMPLNNYNKDKVDEKIDTAWKALRKELGQ
jgi:hypothetical protein